ncbi:MAG: hypothetical protein ACHQ7M_09695 [Chloroflexota bacterium]
MTAIEHRPGAVFWIDHYVLPVNDLTKAADFMEVEIDIPRPAA